MPYYDHDFLSTRKLMVIPQDPESHEKLLNVDRKTANEISSKYQIGGMRDWMANTIANTTLETILDKIALAAKKIVGGEDNEIPAFNFYDLFFVKITNRVSEDADKEGNLMVVFMPGPKAYELISATESPELGDVVHPRDDFGFPEDKAKHEAYQQVDRMARFILANKYRQTLSDGLEFSALAITYRFFLNIFEYLLYELGQDPDKSLASINFNDNVEIHAMRANETDVKFSMRPGMNAKLLIKSDDSTEQDLDDE